MVLDRNSCPFGRKPYFSRPFSLWQTISFDCFQWWTSFFAMAIYHYQLFQGQIAVWWWTLHTNGDWIETTKLILKWPGFNSLFCRLEQNYIRFKPLAFEPASLNHAKERERRDLKNTKVVTVASNNQLQFKFIVNITFD